MIEILQSLIVCILQFDIEILKSLPLKNIYYFLTIEANNLRVVKSFVLTFRAKATFAGKSLIKSIYVNLLDKTLFYLLPIVSVCFTG